jgi:hypothetical protein
LLRIGSADPFLNKRRMKVRTKITKVGARSTLISRVTDKLVEPLLEPRTHRLLFDPSALPKESFHGFISGLLMAMDRATDGGRVFLHRDRCVVEIVHAAISDRAGIPAFLKVDSMEPDVQHYTSATHPHRLIIPAHAIALCVRLGLCPQHDLKPNAPQHTGIRKESIIRVEPIGRHPACIVVSDSNMPKSATANWFLFMPIFDVNPVLTEIAAMDLLLQDPSYPARGTPT